MRFAKLVILIAGMFLTACAGAGGRGETLVAENATLGTEMAILRQTATVAADRQLITLEFIGTVSTQAARRQLSILGTMSALGIDTSRVNAITPARALPTPSPADGAPRVPAVLGGGITAVPATPSFRTPVPTPTRAVQQIEPTIDTSGPYFTDVVTAPGVGDDDCAVGPSTQFDETQAEIYVVARANNFPEGTTVNFNWLRDGATLYTDSFTWNAAIENACVWYFVTPLDFDFMPGTYTAQLQIVDGPNASTVFTIGGLLPPEAEDASGG